MFDPRQRQTSRTGPAIPHALLRVVDYIEPHIGVFEVRDEFMVIRTSPRQPDVRIALSVLDT